MEWYLYLLVLFGGYLLGVGTFLGVGILVFKNPKLMQLCIERSAHMIVGRMKGK